MKIGIIGAGKVGFTLGKYLSIKDVHITGYYSRNAEHALEAAQFIGTTYFENMRELVDASDTLFITTSDGAIGEVWDCIAEYPLENKTICHFSGSLSCDVFSDYEQKDVQVCSVHPFFAFSNKYSTYEQFHKAILTIEGTPLAIEAIENLFVSLGHSVEVIQREDKAKYHAAACLASNAMLGVLYEAVELLGECGFSKESAYRLITPLVRENVNNGLENGAVDALTGPVERGDCQTVQKHLEVLREEEKALYTSVSECLLQMAKIKNPDRDYESMARLLAERSVKSEENSEYI